MKPETKTDNTFWTSAIIIDSALLLIVSLLYFYGYIEISLWITWIAITIPGLAIVYFMDKVHLSDETGNQDDYWKVRYILLGIYAGLLIAFFGSILTIILVVMLGGPNLAHVEGFGELWIMLLIILPIIGGIIGNWVGKRRGYTPILFFWKIDKIFGFN